MNIVIKTKTQQLILVRHSSVRIEAFLQNDCLFELK